MNLPRHTIFSAAIALLPHVSKKAVENGHCLYAKAVGVDGVTLGADDTERHLLYVACTRVRDHLLVTSVEPASEFLDDLRAQ